MEERDDVEKKKENLDEDTNQPKIKENNKEKNDENNANNGDQKNAQKKEEKGEKENEEKSDATSGEEKENKKSSSNQKSVYSLEGAKQPISIYTRRVMDISKIDDYLQPNSTRGRCGGRNLGNTCFMNSSIACLSNCTELTYYFLKGDYKKDINEENILGMRGDLAKSWGELLHSYWVENTHSGNPSEFKSTIGRKAKRFRGYGQQDSNEFMSVFLDYLNEDLNRTTKKEYIELKEKGQNETDEECAKRFWECNLRRNDSIITDLFCGQFKSTITCPKCNSINITFDPFYTINLPLLTQIKKNNSSHDIIDFNFYYIPKYCLRDPISVKVKQIDESKFLLILIDRIKKEKNLIIHDKLDEIYMIDMYNQKVFGTPIVSDKIKKYNYPKELIVSFPYNKKEDELQLPVLFFKKEYINDKEDMSKYARVIFCKKNMSVNDLKMRIYLNLRKYILSPLLKENEEKDEVSLEIEKYIDDKNFELDDNKLIEIIEKEYKEVFTNNNKEDEEEKESEENEDKIEKDEEKADTKNKGESNEGNKDEKKENENKEEKIETENKEEKIETENQKYISHFKKEMPFKISIIPINSKRKIPFVDNKYFTSLSKELKEKFELNSINDTLEEFEKKKEYYNIIVEFNEESKYINKKTFNLDHFDEFEIDFEIKKEKPKNEEEEEEKDDGVMTLAKCLKKFCKEEQLEEGEEWYCSKCKEHVLAKKKMEFFYLPKILIICFKRFVKDSYRWEKNDDEVVFPINDLDMKDFVIGPDKDHSKYDLFAVSQHYGSTGGGHYTALCKNNGKWFSYNDSSCHEASESDALTSAAYVLFYRRQTD